ncbi:GIY-YIG nuclease family protein [Bdellovibrio bacteriovorus]|uniref:exonuclease domain-containing protein n=1 Tax=Bdellovibrio bacteriovorus TaxID=959 RepID=UPI0021D28986|nr:exonuclease domain-containing protein [Bdellovibrio bacteriovorus]UXR65518.1 GIY-YIG nuclease family protein [Bdellovibrio bacteriovorus]
MRLKDLPVFFFDLQTTGAKPDTANILEMAWALSDSSDVRSHLVAQPEDQPVPKRILSLTGIRSEELENAKPLEQVFEVLYNEISDRQAVIHFAQFERPFLAASFEALKLREFPVICTHAIAKRLFPNLPAKGIKGLAGYFGHASGEFKRGSSHVEATQVIWNQLLNELEKQQIATLDELNIWLNQEAPKKTKYEYPMPKEKRLNLPKVPGVYRYLSQWGEILYVGKATSLHDRVNSYFRGQKGRDSFKLEMLTQAYDLIVTPCRTPLEAALLETDEIKKHNPRYNISLKAGERSLVFFSHDFLSMSPEQDDEHFIGPFSSALVFDSILKLNESLRSEDQVFDPNMFYEPLDSELLKAGFEIFCTRHQEPMGTFVSMRSIFALGLYFVKNAPPEEELDGDIEMPEEEEIEVELTAEDIADKFERHFKRAAQAYLRARKLTKLLNSDIEYALSSKGPRFALHFRNGQRIEESSLSEATISSPRWQDSSVVTYDRMAVLLSELERVRSKKGHYNLT